MVTDYTENYISFAESQGASQYAWLEYLFMNEMPSFEKLKKDAEAFLEDELKDDLMIEQLSGLQILHDHYRWKKGLGKEPKELNEHQLYDRILLFQFSLRLVKDLFTGKAEVEEKHPDDDLSWKWKVIK